MKGKQFIVLTLFILFNRTHLIVFLLTLWLLVAIIVIFILNSNRSNKTPEKRNRFHRNRFSLEKYKSILLKIDRQFNKAKLISNDDIEAKLIHYSKAFDNLLRLICDYNWDASDIFDNNNIDKSNYNYIELLSKYKTFNENTIDDLHRARIMFNSVKHELDYKDVDKNFLVNITDGLYNCAKNINS